MDVLVNRLSIVGKMSAVFWIVSLVTSTLFSLFSTARAKVDETICSLKMTSTFCDYSQGFKPHRDLKNEKWALISAVVFKSKQPLHLKRLSLQWKGKPLNHVYGSLYHKREIDKELIPIEDNLVCDGSWSPQKQQFSFIIDKKIIAVDEFYLVISYPERIEDTIKKGKFVIPRKLPVMLSLARQ